MEKRCRHCGIVKPLEEFHRNTAVRDGRRPECKVCIAAKRKARYEQDPKAEIARVKAWQAANPDRHRANQKRRRDKPEVKARERNNHLRRKFGITSEQYEQMLEEQGGVCALCRRTPRHDISLHVDHDHTTGANRKLLCFRCNNALGDLDDDPALLRAAADYLEQHDPEVQELADLTRQRLAALRA